mgnify:CR=1 FL=1
MGERFKIACAVHLILIKDGKILLQRRNNPNKHGYGMLGMPAGHLEANENVYDAFKREMKEELDIDIIDCEIVQVMNLNGDTDVYDAYFFTCDYSGDIKNMEEDNAKSLEWIDINSNIEKLMPYQKYALSKYLENCNDNKFTLYGWN